VIEKKKILLTGGTGFLGSSILKSLNRNLFDIILLKRSFSNLHRIESVILDTKAVDIDEVSLEDIFSRDKIDIILHCATDYGRKNSDSFQIVEANLRLPLQLIQLGHKQGVKCFINTDTILDKRINDYTLSKNQFKEWLAVFSSKMVCINVALEHFYGPGDDTTKFVSYIIQKIISEAESIDLTSGEQERDFIYIDDTVSAFCMIIDKCLDYNIGLYKYEVGTGYPQSIRVLTEMIKKISGNTKTKLNFGALPYRENEVMKCLSNNTGLKKLGWNCRYDLAAGLKKTIDIEKNRGSL
jgi:CDP-paratose synthetase